MPRLIDQSSQHGPMTATEIEAMNAGTAKVKHDNGSNWLGWMRKGVYYVKHVSGEMPEGQETDRAGHLQGTPRKMSKEDFFGCFSTDDPDFVQIS